MLHVVTSFSCCSVVDFYITCTDKLYVCREGSDGQIWEINA